MFVGTCKILKQIISDLQHTDCTVIKLVAFGCNRCFLWPAVDGGALVSAETIAKMKDGVVIINTSRGSNVDEDALLAALESGKVRAAGLDVYVDEPTKNKALYSHPMVSCTPHIGAATVEAQKRIGAEIVEIIKAM